MKGNKLKGGNKGDKGTKGQGDKGTKGQRDIVCPPITCNYNNYIT